MTWRLFECVVGSLRGRSEWVGWLSVCEPGLCALWGDGLGLL